jgi:hypothetical protein
VTPTRNWDVVGIYRAPLGSARCGKCNAQLAHVFELRQGDEWMLAGAECIKALTHVCDPATARRAIDGRWHERRGYIYKRLKGVVWSIGERKTGRWWVGRSKSVARQRQFEPTTYATIEDAKHAVALMASTAGSVR